MRWLITLAFLPATLSADEPRRTDLFERGQGGYHTYRIPALVVTNDGTLLAFCEGRKTSARDDGDIDLILRRSEDGGRTWDDVRLVHEEGGDEPITIGNPCPVVDRSTGTVWLPFCRDNDDVFVTHSDDDGRTWAKPRLITPDVKPAEWGWYATGPGNGIQLTRGPHRGRLVIPCDFRPKGRQGGQFSHSHVFYSDDHGRTWRLGGVTESNMNECAVVELDDGRLMLNMRSYRGKNRRGVATSDDGGKTWSRVTDDPTLIEPVCQASLIRHSWPVDGKGGVLVFSNPASNRRERLTVRLSGDEGQTWSAGRSLHEGSAAYSSLVVLPDGDIGILFERDGYRAITFARFGPAWVSSGE